jgi:Holliday junction resolvasome RuvABC endonuclease subunit
MVKNIEPKDQTEKVRNRLKELFDSRKVEYLKQQTGAEKLLKDFSDANQQYLNQYNPYANGIERTFIFKRTSSPTDIQKTNATNLFSTVNVGSDNKIYNLKKKLD